METNPPTAGVPTDNGPLLQCDDIDEDGICDDQDPCPIDADDDSDGDGVCDSDDVCPGASDSEDLDGDGQPDACDPCPSSPNDDSDADGVCNDADLCPDHDDTLDLDTDGIPDGCDLCPFDEGEDSDADGVCDAEDRCPGFDDHADQDSDGVPDGCDACPLDELDDSDADGVCDSLDSCPGFDDLEDTDGDLVADGCDACPLDAPDDSDADGVCDSADVCPDSDDAADGDGDGVPDGCDLCPADALDDSDGDGSCDSLDTCPGFEDTLDTDGDGTPDGCDPCPIDAPNDTDSDGVCESQDICPGSDDTLDTDGDGIPNGCDVCPADASDDSDGDGVCDAADSCPGSNDSVDSDADGTPDGCDACPADPNDDSDGDGSCDSDDLCPGSDDRLDTDADGTPNTCDACPLDALDDSDGDGSCDSDDLCPGEDDRVDGDGDGAPDACDACPVDALNDTDGDGVCDSVDLCPDFDDSVDGDGDGVPDGCDLCPLDAEDDSDGDGSCDADDVCPGGDDGVDTDGDTVPDVCDVCPLDALDDSDGDGTCDSDDLCAGEDDRLDLDGDGNPDACDPCPADPMDDSDADGTCDSADLCPGADDTADVDGDGEIDGCEIRINEFCSENDTVVVLPDGSTPDWIELYNPGPSDVSLAGYGIIDSLNRPEVPLDAALVVPAGGTLMLYASDDETLGPDHLPFKLNNDGDDLYLYKNSVLVDGVDFDELIDDVSIARVSFDDWVVSDTPTPDALNPVMTGGLDPIDQPCKPEWNGQRFVTEGETLQVDAVCTEPGSFDLEVFGPAPGLSGLSISWATTVSDAGTIDMLLSAKPAGHRGVPETKRREISVADAWNDPANVQVDPMTYKKEWGLPVLHLETTAPLTPDYTDVTGILDGVSYAGQMKKRGAASLGYPKNSYTLEFDPISIPLGDYGLQKKDHLVLISPFDDNSYIRQRLVYETWKDMADFWMVDRLTPRTMDMIVYIDGEYVGFYTGIDHIDDEFVREMDFDDSGDMYKSVHHHANFKLTNATGAPKTNLAQGWEKKEGTPENDFTTMEDLTAFTGNATPGSFAADHASWVDLEDMMDWYWLVRHTASSDSAGKNAYLYLDPVSGQFRYVPWDFNHSWGQSWRTMRVGVNALSDFNTRNHIFQLTSEEPTLNAQREARYAAMRDVGGPFHLDEMQARADRLLDSLGPNGARDFEKWESAYQNYGNWNSRTDFTTHEEEVAYVLQWMEDRDAVMGAAHP